MRVHSGSSSSNRSNSSRGDGTGGVEKKITTLTETVGEWVGCSIDRLEGWGGVYSIGEMYKISCIVVVV